MKINTISVKFNLLFAVLIFIVSATSGFSQSGARCSISESPLPAPTGYVNDYVGVIDAQTKQNLEQKLKNLKETSSPQVEIGVAVVGTTGDCPIFEYSLGTARGWKIGSKEDDNPSALLVIAINDRKYFTQTSKDLEDELPDGLVGSLQRQYLVPAFKQGDYSKGVSDTIDAYIRTIKERGNGTVAATPEVSLPSGGGRSESALGTFGCCAIALFILLIIILSRGGRGGGGRGGYGGGGFGSALPWIIGSVIANSGSSSSSSGGWGGSSGGSDGGFGGFGGGGDFGGGGAGGDW